MTKNKTTAVLLCSMAFVFAASGGSFAGDDVWRVYSEESNGDVYFFDTSRVMSTSNSHRVWTRIRYKRSVMAASSYQSLLEVDCAARTEKTVQRTFFSDKEWEVPAMSTDMKAKAKRAIREGSATDRLSKVLCDQ